MKFKFQNSLKEIGIWSLGSDFIVLNSTIMSRIFILSSLVKLYNFVQRTFTLWNSLSYARKKTQVWHMYYTVYKLLYHSWNINTIIANIPGLSSAPFLHLWLMRSIVNVNNLVCRCLSFQKCDRIKWFYNALYHLSINIHKLWIRQSFFFLCHEFLLLWLYTSLVKCSVGTRTRCMKAIRIQYYEWFI